ncbi:MAG: response regulator [Spirochaetales bacterium]|nr:response regulator [Spirochaetales bacterium]
MKKKILLVDDSDAARGSTRFSLTIKGFDILEAANGKEGIDVLNTQQGIDLIITDVNMPVMDGISFVKEARKHDSYSMVPIIIRSSEDAMVQEGINAGASAWVSKGANSSEELLKAIHKLI